MIETTETQPDDLADGVYRDTDGDLWLVREGVAFVMTDVIGFQHDLGDLVPSDLGSGIDADIAHSAYVLRMLYAL
ncbi:hypothetical protein [Microbacterium sp. XT11]|uniref:hypothetical protein n=1 Tax=Microbacterium sp. XT11 TaxID=367477 RepID=UPI000834DBD2|nr:hypothetical protein [Microbacterium sp. XT11]